MSFSSKKTKHIVILLSIGYTSISYGVFSMLLLLLGLITSMVIAGFIYYESNFVLYDNPYTYEK